MQTSPSPARQDGQRPAPFKERRRQPEQSSNSRLRWLRSLMRRPFRLSWEGGPHWVWVERRRPDTSALELKQLHADLRTEMLTVDDAALVLRELVQVDERLGQAGWAGLAKLPAATLLRARLQAEMLAESSGSAPLAHLAQRLRVLQASPAASGEEPSAFPPAQVVRGGAVRPDEVSIEVSELDEDDYVQAEQAWASSQPAPLAPPPPAAPGDDVKA